MKLIKYTLILILILNLSILALGSDYPTKPIKVIVPYAAGGGTDVFARVVGRYIELEQPFVITNISGAGAKIGTKEAEHAKPDGYTLLLHTYAIVIGYHAKLYDEPVWRNFEPIASLTIEDNAISARVDAPFDTVEELINYAKNNPGAITWGYGGFGGVTHTASAQFCEFANIDVSFVPYQGAADTRAAIAGGHVDVVVNQVSEVADLYEDGQIKILATTGENRNPATLEVPTVLEEGINYKATMWRGLFAPKDTPKEIVNKLEDALKQLSENEEFLQRLSELNYGVRFRNSEEFRDLMEEDAKAIELIAHIYEE